MARIITKKGVKVNMLKLFPTTALILSVAVGGVALTESAVGSQNDPGTRPYVYKNAQPNAHARPNPQAVEPGAKFHRPYLYKNSQQEAHARPKSFSQGRMPYNRSYGYQPNKAPWPKVGPSPFKAPE